jgi:hypothetical protein
VPEAAATAATTRASSGMCFLDNDDDGIWGESGGVYIFGRGAHSFDTVCGEIGCVCKLFDLDPMYVFMYR